MPRQDNEVVGDKRDEIAAAQIDLCDVRLTDQADRGREQLNLMHIRQILKFGHQARIGCENDRSTDAGLGTARRLSLTLPVLARFTTATRDMCRATRIPLAACRTATGV